MNKKLIRLTESDLHRIVKESVNRILRESQFGNYRVSRSPKKKYADERKDNEGDWEDHSKNYESIEEGKRILREDAENVYRGVSLPYNCDIKVWGPKIDICLDEKGWSTDKIQRAIDWHAHQERVDYQHKW